MHFILLPLLKEFAICSDLKLKCKTGTFASSEHFYDIKPSEVNRLVEERQVFLKLNGGDGPWNRLFLDLI